MHTRTAASAAVVVLAALPIAAAPAQAPPPRDTAAASPLTDTGAVTLRGVVRDTAGRPLLGAQVMTAEATTITDADGRFELRDLRADTLHLLIRRIGHQPAAITLAPDRGVVVEFAATLVPNVVELGTIIVEGRTMDRRLWNEGFYDREKLGFGTFFDAGDLGRYASLESALRMAPSVHMTRAPDGRVAALGQTPFGHCALTVYVDGTLVRWAHEIGLETLVPQGEVLALEVYARASQVPAKYRIVGGMPGSATTQGIGIAGPVECGAIAIWTKPYGEVR